MRRAALPLALAVLAATPAVAAAPMRISITGFDLLQVNQVVVHVKPGGSHPLCQAIPITAIRVKTKWSGGHKGDKVVVRLVPPRGASRKRTLVLTGTSGRRSAQFDPHGEFHGGTYRARVAGAKASFRLSQGKTC